MMHVLNVLLSMSFMSPKFKTSLPPMAATGLLGTDRVLTAPK